MGPGHVLLFLAVMPYTRSTRTTVGDPGVVRAVIGKDWVRQPALSVLFLPTHTLYTQQRDFLILLFLLNKLDEVM